MGVAGVSCDPAGFRLGDSEGPSEQVTPSVVAPPPEVSNNELVNMDTTVLF